MNDIEKAYLAGLVDGEGSIGLYLKNHRTDFSLRLAVYNTDDTLMAWLQIHIGGLVHKVGRRHNPKHRQEYCWYLSSTSACETLKLILPYLVIKRAKAEIAIDAWEHRQPTPRELRRKPMSQAIVDLRQRYINSFRELPSTRFHEISQGA